jgi:hypothetical protein
LGSDFDHTADSTAERVRVGLCTSCRHAERISSTRGATFYLCRLAFADASYKKYPRLPVQTCTGHDALK